MSQPSGTIYEVRWQELCPWLVLGKALRVSLLIRVLLYAWLGLLLTQGGWTFCESLFAEPTLKLPRLIETDYSLPDERQSRRALRERRLYASQLLISDKPDLFIRTSTNPDWWGLQAQVYVAGPLIEGWSFLSTPVVKVFRLESTWLQTFQLLLCGGWAIAVWGIFGGAIARTAARYCTLEEIIGPVAAGRAAITKWLSTTGAPLIALTFAFLMTIPLALVGVLLRVNLLAMLVGFLWFLMLVWGVLLAILLVALWFGWPLMWATIAVERSDAFDAASRTAAYVYQRPLRLVFYIVIASLLGVFGQLVVSGFVAAGNHLTDWAISWGSGTERITQLAFLRNPGEITPPLTGSAALAVESISFWKHMLATVTAAYPLAYLFSASVGIYLLLRLHVDSTEMEEIVGDGGEEMSHLPEIKNTDIKNIDHDGPDINKSGPEDDRTSHAAS